MVITTRLIVARFRLKMHWSPIGWLFKRGKIQIAVVTGHV